MAGPMVNLMPGNISCNACATTCDVECQKAFLPSVSFHVYKVRLPSWVRGVVVSMVVSLNLAEMTLRANPSLILLAMAMGVVPRSTCLMAPSGSLMLIIFSFEN